MTLLDDRFDSYRDAVTLEPLAVGADRLDLDRNCVAEHHRDGHTHLYGVHAGLTGNRVYSLHFRIHPPHSHQHRHGRSPGCRTESGAPQQDLIAGLRRMCRELCVSGHRQIRGPDERNHTLGLSLGARGEDPRGSALHDRTRRRADSGCSFDTDLEPSTWGQGWADEVYFRSRSRNDRDVLTIDFHPGAAQFKGVAGRIGKSRARLGERVTA